MARRRDWAGLSDDYRARLQGAGITRADYEAGASLRSARGHSAAYPGPRERREIIGRLDADQQTLADRQAIRRWSESKARPAWTKASGAFPLSDELALRMQAAGVRHPRTWEEAPGFTPAPRGEDWTMRVMYKDGTYAEVKIPWGMHDEALAFGTDAAGEYPDLGELTIYGY